MLKPFSALRAPSIMAALLLGVAACGGSDGTDPDPNGVSITSFTASPTTVANGGTTMLSWKVANAESISITANGTDIGVAATMFEGSTTSPAISANTTFRLTATGGGKSVNKEVMVTVDANAVQVLTFTATPNPAPSGGNTTLSWTTAGATTVKILEGATERFSSTEMVASGSYQVTLSQSSHTFTLEASNGSQSDSETVTVTTDTPAAITSFTANPTSFSGAMASVTLAWEATGTLSLTANGSAVSGFPGGDTGSMMVDVTDTTTFVLTAAGPGGPLTATAIVTKVAGETEPNDTSANANPLGMGGGAAAEINPGSDVDFYSVMVPAGGWVRAETSDGMGGCNLDTVMRLYDTDGTTELGTDDEGGNPGPGSGNCSKIDPADDDFAVGLAGGTYFISVESFQGNETGAYVLTVQTGAPQCGNSILEGATEQCDDGNTVDGDGCSATCQIEIDGMVSPPGGNVVVTVGDENANPRLIQVTIASTGQSITATTTDGAGGCPLDTIIGLFDSDFDLLGVRDGGEGGCASFDPRVDRFAADLEAGTYYIGVANEGATAGGMVTVEVTIENPGCGNGIHEQSQMEACDDGNTMAGDGCSATCTPEPLGTVTGLDQDQTFSHAIDPAGQSDFYEVVMPADGYIRAETGVPTMGMCDGTPRDTVLELLDSTFASLGEDDDGGEGLCSLIDPSIDGFAQVSAGTYYVRVRAYSASAVIAAYQLQITTAGFGCGNNILEPGEQCDDGNTTPGDLCDASCNFEGTFESEPNDDAGTANSSGLSGAGTVVVAGAITPMSGNPDFDWYSFQIPSGTATLSAQTHTNPTDLMTCSGGDTVIELIDSNGTALTDDDDGGQGLCSFIDGSMDTAAQNLAAGTYYIKVRTFSSGASMPSYYLTITLQ